MNKMHDTLIDCPLFLGLKADDIKNLFSEVHHQVLKYRNGELIAHSGEEIKGQLIVLKGSVKGEMMDFNGKTIKIEDIISPRPLAPAFLFGNKNTYPVNIVANEDVKILSIPKSSFIHMMQLNEKVLQNFLNIISNRAQFLSNKIKFLSFQSIKGKLAHYLLNQMKLNSSETVILDKSQSQLAELFGVERPSLGRAMRELDQDGLIDAKGKHVSILDKERLSALLK